MYLKLREPIDSILYLTYFYSRCGLIGSSSFKFSSFASTMHKASPPLES